MNQAAECRAADTNSSPSLPTNIVNSNEEWTAFDSLPPKIKDYLRDAFFNWDSISALDLLMHRRVSCSTGETETDLIQGVIRALQSHEREVAGREREDARLALSGSKQIRAPGGGSPGALSSSRAPSSKGSDGASKSKRRTR